jgi:hypothetical protein
MIISDWINYVFYRFITPHEASFADMGLGIRARARRFSAQWAPHLRCSRDFIERNSRGDTAILGAGRLFDVPVAELAARGKVYLIDNDPGAVGSWRKICDSEAIFGLQQDVSGIFREFNLALKDFFKRFSTRDDAALIDFVADFTARASSSDGLKLPEQPETIVSVNLLSQIPVYFIDELCTATAKFWGFSPTVPPPEAINGAYRAFGEMLQRQHLKMLAKSGARRVIVITDLEYYYYLPKEPRWQVEEGLYLEENFIPKLLCQMTGIGTDTWWWHIVPAGKEAAHGEIHKVLALAFERSDFGATQ